MDARNTVQTAQRTEQRNNERSRAQSSETRSGSMLHEMEQTRLAIEMIGLGARLQVLESEVALPRARLIRLYKELCGVSPPKGMLPFSTDWFAAWRPNAHASMLLNAYRFMAGNCGLERSRAMLAGYACTANRSA